MLPDGFQWRSYVDGPALYLGERMLAVCAAIPTGCRVDLVLAQRRSEFFPSEADAVRYLEAWARKWEERIRREAGIRPVSGWDVGKP